MIVSTYPCFILYVVFKRDQTNDIHLERFDQWLQRESNFGGDAEGIKEQLQGIKRVSFLLDDNVGAIESVVSPCEVCAKQRNYRFKRKFMRKWRQLWLMVTVFVSLLELIEAPHRVHTVTGRLTAPCRLACDSRNLTNFAGDIRYFVPGWPNIAGDVLPASPVALTPMGLTLCVCVSLPVCVSVCLLACLCHSVGGGYAPEARGYAADREFHQQGFPQEFPEHSRGYGISGGEPDMSYDSQVVILESIICCLFKQNR